MNGLDLMKALLNVSDNSQDSILGYFLQKAEQIIKEYCNEPVLTAEINTVVAEYAAYLYNHRNEIGMIKKAEGEKSVTFEIGIPENIRLALPLPRIKVGGY